MRTVCATRYVTPLREGGSLPAIVEADDLGMYVLKFRGAGQGVLALVAEVVAGEIGRALGLPVPEIVFMEVDAALGRNEPDQEIQALLQASAGINLGLDYLPGSVMFDLAARDTASPEIASATVWFDSLVTNVDRTASNPNLIWWHRSLYLIDHGAALYFHHNWSSGTATAAEIPFSGIRKHVLLPWASEIASVAGQLRRMLTPDLLMQILGQVPDDWLTPEEGITTPDEKRAAYHAYFIRRLAAAHIFTEEAVRARAELV
ncbi:MAG: aminotransferase class I and II [Bryobacteraceae bacterium]|nr:aminotransferase class I and II [Bryobacteraceae bacterium]